MTRIEADGQAAVTAPRLTLAAAANGGERLGVRGDPRRRCRVRFALSAAPCYAPPDA